MREYMYVALLALLLALATGCIGGSQNPSAEQIQDRFLRNNVSSYEYSGTMTYEYGAVGGPTRTSTTETESTISYRNKSLHANITSTTETPNGTRTSITETYLVNETIYSRSLRGGNSTGWATFEHPNEINNTWQSRDELSVYESVLRNASLNYKRTIQMRNQTVHEVEVNLSSTGQSRFLKGKFRDSSLFNDAQTDSFDMRVWITKKGSLLQSETSVRMTLPDQQIQSGRADIRAGMQFNDNFSYPRSVSIELPSEIAN